MKSFFLLTSFFVLSCNPNATPLPTPEPAKISKEQPKAVVSPETKTKKKTDFQEFRGNYVGDFVALVFDSQKKPSISNMINIRIDEIREKDHVIVGYSIVAGNKRPFQGNFQFIADVQLLQATLKEPGDHKYDGSFTISINMKNQLKGTWVSNDKKIAVHKRGFQLKKSKFKYNKNARLIPKKNWHFINKGRRNGVSEDAIKINASTTLLRDEDINNVSGPNLEVIRNTIFARHGYAFKTRKFRYFFEHNNKWYAPYSTDVQKSLSSIEISNIVLLKRYERYDKELEGFGR